MVTAIGLGITLEMAVRGLATQQQWEPIGTGLKVRFKGVSSELRDIVVRKVDSHFPVVMILNHKEVVELPLKPGKYSVETGLQRERPADMRKTPATVGEEGYLEVVVEK